MRRDNQRLNTVVGEVIRPVFKRAGDRSREKFDLAGKLDCTARCLTDVVCAVDRFIGVCCQRLFPRVLYAAGETTQKVDGKVIKEVDISL